MENNKKRYSVTENGMYQPEGRLKFEVFSYGKRKKETGEPDPESIKQKVDNPPVPLAPNQAHPVSQLKDRATPSARMAYERAKKAQDYLFSGKAFKKR